MNKVLRKLKKVYKKIKYRDRLTTRFYVTFISISSFILFLGGTYSYFNIFEHENAAVITISKLKYMLTSTNSDYQENSITVSAGQTLDLTLNLKSLNNIRTRYALVYSSASSDVKVYYDGVREQNVLGEISTLNSIIDIKLVIENTSSEAQTVTFELKGGYLQNTLDSNIIEQYIRDPLIPRLVNSILNKESIPTDSVIKKWTPDFNNISPSAGEYTAPEKYSNLTSIMNDSTYPFNKGVDGVFTSTNKVNSSTSTLMFSPAEEIKSEICYEISSESNYDKIKIYLDDTLKKEDSGEKSSCIDVGTINSSNVIKVEYSKDSSQSKGKDEVKVFLTYPKVNQINDDSGMYSMEDDYGTSYYYRGNIKNNYVKFGTWKEGENSGKDMYWRIIRVNGDGSVRMIYDGTSPHENGESSEDRLVSTNVVWNTLSDDAKYVGYMYGGASGIASTSKEEAQTNETDSNIKQKIENWYRTNLGDKDEIISDNIFCNDRSIPGVDLSGWNDDTGLGYGKNKTAYGSYTRFYSGDFESTTTTPTLMCSNKTDSFTKSNTTKGNGKLEEKVGLITTDEASIVGLNTDYPTENNFLYKGYFYWTMTPETMRGDSINWGIEKRLGSNLVSESAFGLVPVININANVAANFIGKGTKNEPYQPHEIEITFDPNGGEVEAFTKKVIVGSIYSTMPKPIKSGYDFIGWYKTSNGEDKISNSTHIKLNVNHTLYAIWQECIKPVKGSLAEKLINKANSLLITDYNSGIKEEMFTFNHLTSLQILDWTESERTDYRYIGNTPNNYINFNNETWRIIGVFTVENKAGEKELRIKIIRDQSIGDFPWDKKADGMSDNRWPTSSLATMLNGDYVNKGGSFTYTWYDYKGTANNTTVVGLNSTAKSQISQAKWFLAGEKEHITRPGSSYYLFERGSQTCTTQSGCTGGSRSIITTSYVGLMYPSDYIYTYANEVDNKCYTDGYHCRSIKTALDPDNFIPGRPSSGWLFNSEYQWTITQGTRLGSDVFDISSLGVNASGSPNIRGVRPCVYLKSDIEIISGDGSEDNPYILNPNQYS